MPAPPWPARTCTGTPASGAVLFGAYPASPHDADQTRLFSRKQWLPDRFCQSQIMADPQFQVTTVTG
jgi:hypothetical protein